MAWLSSTNRFIFQRKRLFFDEASKTKVIIVLFGQRRQSQQSIFRRNKQYLSCSSISLHLSLSPVPVSRIKKLETKKKLFLPQTDYKSRRRAAWRFLGQGCSTAVEHTLWQRGCGLEPCRVLGLFLLFSILSVVCPLSGPSRKCNTCTDFPI